MKRTVALAILAALLLTLCACGKVRQAEEAIDAALSEALAAGASVKDAAAEIAGRFGLPKREIYARALFLSRNG